MVRKFAAYLLLYSFGLDVATLRAAPLPYPQAVAHTVAGLDAASADAVSLDLRGWSREGEPGAGDWQVSPDGAAAVQASVGNWSFLVSPEPHLNATLRGQLTIPAGDGFVGFVLGYRSPLAADGDEPDAADFLLLDWKQATSGRGGSQGREGFTLSRLQGTVANPQPAYWSHAEGPQLHVLAESHAAGTGWVSGRRYQVEIAYRKSRVRLSLDGRVVLDATGSFPAGRFGFYTYLQKGARFEDFTAEGGNADPHASAGADQTVDAGAGCAASVTLDGSGSSDPDGDVLAYNWTGPFGSAPGVRPTVSLPAGTSAVSLTVDDGNGATAAADVTVSILDRQPPVLSCPAALRVSTAAGQCQASNLALPPPAVADNCAVAALTNNAPASFPHGTTFVRWTATDSSGYLSSCIHSVTVDDATPPVVQATVDQSLLWPPNHVMVNVGLHASAADTCGDRPAVSVKVFSDEPDEFQSGDGHTLHDAQVVSGTVNLRAERRGDADGRVYLLVVSASDPAGNQGHGCRAVSVPHSQSKADRDSVAAQARAAESYCESHGTAPPAYLLLTEGSFTQVNHAPFVDAGPDRTITLPTNTVTLIGTATDDGLPEGGRLTATWTKVGGPGAVTFGSPHATTTTASFDAPGLYVLRLTATDSELGASADVSVNVVQANRPPTVSAGQDHLLVPPSDTMKLQGSVADDGLPAGTLTSSWSVLSGPGTVVFATPTSTSTVATFTSRGVYLLRLTASDGELQASDEVTVAVDAVLLSLEPARAGPNVRGTSQSLKATLTGRSGNPMPGVDLAFGITGANALTGRATTDGDGVATFAYSGAAVGEDTVRASATTPHAAESNPATISWIAPSQPIGTTTILGRFFEADGSGVFNTRTNELPVFSQALPVLLFNPPDGVVPGCPPGVDETTRPFTDVVTDGAGDVSGTIVAEGNGVQAGSGSLESFSAVFTGQLLVAAAGDVTFAFHSADGFVFGVGGGATRVSGTLTNPPASGLTPFEGLVVVGSANVAGGLSAATATIHFPAPGVYPYEVDYAEGLGGPLALTMTVEGHPVAPVGSLVLSPAAPAPKLIGEQQTLTVQAVDGAGGPVGGLPIELVVTGPNAQQLHAVADVRGHATFSYTGDKLGADQAQAAALVTGMIAFSNAVTLNWQDRANQAPIVSGGPDQVLSSSSDAASLDGSASDDGLPGGGTLTLSWSKLSGPGAVSFADPQSATTTASLDAPGAYILRLTASDTELISTSDVRVTVVGSNQPPVVWPGPDLTVTVGRSLALDGTVTDDGLPAGSMLTSSWSVVSGPGVVAISRSDYDARRDFSASANPTGAWSYGYELMAGGTFFPMLVASNYSSMPSWSRGDPAVLPFPLYYPFVAFNDKGGPFTFGVPSETIPSDLLLMIGAEDTARSVVRWIAPRSGSFRVEGRFQGLIHTTSAATVLLNSGTTLLPTSPVGPNQAVALSFVQAVSAGDTLDFILGNGGNGNFGDNTGFNVVITPINADHATATFDAPGVYVLTLNASDGELTSRADVRVTVSTADGNTPPVVSAGQDQVISLPVDSVTLRGSVSDDGFPGGPLTAAWSQVGGPAGVTFDVPTFSAAAAPNLDCLPARGWSYGFTATQGSAFQPLTVVGNGNYYGIPSCQHGEVYPDTYPLIGFNTTGDTLTWSNVVQPADELAMHPGQFGEKNVLRWTAPEAGTYRIEGRFEGISLGGSTVDVAILYNSTTPLLSDGIGSFGETQPFSLLRTVSEGDTIDFSVGFGANNNFFGDSTGLAATITRADLAVTTATFTTPGVYLLRLTASDGQLTSTDDVVVTLTEPDDPPLVNAGPDLTITLPSHIVVLGGSVTDDGRPTGGTITSGWAKISGPGPAIFETPLAVVSAVSFSVPGVYVLRLTASDSLRLASDDVTVTVRPANHGPVVDAGADQSITLPTTTVALSGSVTDDGEPAGQAVSVSWRAVGGPLGGATIAAPSSAVTDVSFAYPGVYVLRLAATDGALAASDDLMVTVVAAAPVGPPPAVGIDSPAEGAVVTTPTEIVGSVAAASLLGWRLEYKGDGDSGWTRFAAGSSPVEGVLTHFDPTLLLNGLYEVRLSASDTSGRSQTVSFHAVVRDNMKVGNFTVSFVDLEVPLAGLPIRVTRTYDSRDKRVGDFGVSWRLDVSSVRVGKSGVAGLSWFGTASPGLFPTYCLEPTRPSLVTVTMPDAKVYEFEPTLSRSCQFAIPLEETTVGFRARPGTAASLEPVDGGDVFAVGSWPGPVHLYNTADFSLYDPSLFRLRLPDGRAFIIDQRRGLQSLSDLSGNTVTVTSGGITHSSGKSVVFTRDGQGRITSIADPGGASMVYGYDGHGDLVSCTDRESHVTTFTYASTFPHHLKEIRDALGRTPIRNEYYDDGRLKSHTDAFGKTIGYVHDVDARQEVVTDRNGGVRVLAYDIRGNVVREVDPKGKQVLRSFDERNNRLSETLPHDPGATNPPTTSYVYDTSDNLLATSDPLSHTTSYVYNGRKQVLSVTDAGGRTTANVYDVKGNLLSTTDALGRTTSYSYDAQGNALTLTDALNGVTRYEYDAFGHVTKETDALGHETAYTYDGNGNRLTQTTMRTTPAGMETLVTSYEYDRQGRLTKTTDPDSSFTRMVYDELGLRSESYDKLGHRTSYDYDAMGRLVRTTYPDRSFEESTYDAEGRRLTNKDRAGRVTSYEYDPLGRLTKIIYADTAFTTSAYDDAGRLVSTKDARGNPTRYEYDLAGRRTKVIDASTHETVFTYDAAGNQTSVKDARGNTITYEYDALNRRTKTIYPDTTFTLTAYDALGRRASETDQAGRTTRFGYDNLGRLTGVTDAANQRTSYSYDDMGNRTGQKDANLHETRLEYDKLGRETKRILPEGKSETKAYDAAGNLETRTDFMGRVTRYAYDDNSRLLSRTYLDSSQNTSFTYTPTGRRLTAIDARGTTSYGYDLRDRLTSLTYPDGRRLEYEHDLQGNRTKLSAVLSAARLATSYSFDSLNRLATVKDPQDRTYSYTYDVNGNRDSLNQPNGTLTGYIYDTLNRLTSLATSHPTSGRTIQGYTFSLGATGNRTQIAEGDGTVRAYTYDALYRLTGERVTVNNLLQYEKAFAYDPVGNRQTQSTTGAGATGTPTAPGTIAYSYDARDRLLTENATTYGWDDNGNLVTKSGEAAYTWDFENRLVKVTKADGTVVETTYDADGNRVRTKTTPPTGAPQVTNYLVDTSGSLSQVVADTDDAGSIKTLYVRGDDLLSLMRPSGSTWTTRFYHADGLGSIRRLTDESGNITDGYSYTAFGELIGHTGSDQQPYAFAGEPYDPNVGFQYHRARWMDPRVGRFAGMDPFEGDTFEPSSLHKYLYASANPENVVDPSGRDGFSVTEMLMVAAIAGAIWGGLNATATGVAGGTKRQLAKDFGVNFLAAAAVSATIYAVIWGGVLAYIAGAAGVTLTEANRIQQFSDGGKVYIVKLDRAVTVSRWWGGKASESGPWWTTEVYGSSSEAINRLALRPEWGNTAASMSTGVIQSGETVIMSRAASYGALLGGGVQVYVSDPSVVAILH